MFTERTSERGKIASEKRGYRNQLPCARKELRSTAQPNARHQLRWHEAIFVIGGEVVDDGSNRINPDLFCYGA